MEKLLEQSVNKLRKGTDLEEVVLSVPKENQEELKALLQTSLLLMKVPTQEAPTPSFRRKYILEPVKQKFWASIFHVSRFAAGSTAFIVLFAIFAIGGYKALQSYPGQRLFSVKRTAESFRLKFVMSEASKAHLQLAFAESRLNEAQAILNNPASNKQQEIAALQELSKQTQTATESVQQVAHSQPLDSSSHPLVNKLETLAKQQTQLIAKTQEENQDADVKIAANNAAGASESATNQAGQIKKYLTIAESSVDPITLADLSSDPDPNTVSISGVIQKIGLYSITVEKTPFQITVKTDIKNLNGQKLNFDDLKLEQKIKISGKKDNSSIVAQSILVLNKDEIEDGQIKGASTSTPESTTTPAQTGTTTPSILKPTNENLQPLESENPRLGNFIIENPNPQYKP